MHDETSNPPLRLVAVATDARRATALCESVLAEFPSDGHRQTVVESVPATLTSLRSGPCDAVIALHDRARLDTLTLARALRGAGDETPLAILGEPAAIDFESEAWEAGADEYACVTETTAAQLAGRLRRAIDARGRTREVRRLLQADGQRLAQERAEVEELIEAQRLLLGELRSLPDDAEPPADAPVLRLAGDAAEADYDRLARAGLLGELPSGEQWRQVADRMAAQSMTGPALLERHLAIVERETAGLADRATRRVRMQADRLLLEATVHLAEAYRRRYVAASEEAQPAPPAQRAA